MAQLIVSSRYLKIGKRGRVKRKNYTKYIATRESVEKRSQHAGESIENQNQLRKNSLYQFLVSLQYSLKHPLYYYIVKLIKY